MKSSIQTNSFWEHKVKDKHFIMTHFEDMCWIYDVQADEIEFYTEHPYKQRILHQTVNDVIPLLLQRYQLVQAGNNDPYLIYGKDVVSFEMDHEAINTQVLTQIDLDSKQIFGCTLLLSQSMDIDLANQYLQQQQRLISLMEENVRLNYLIRKDKLTSLYNKAFIEEQLDVQCGMVRRYHRECSVIFFDIDHFKRINDNFGHSVGDEVLIAISSLISNHIRSTDMLARWGGEEFLLLLPETGIEEAKIVANKICSLVEQHDFDIVKKVTISLGVTLVLASDTVLSILNRVDKALYKAKHSGRNQVVVYQSDEEIPFASMKISWRHVWDSGHSQIDAQHKNLIDLANQLLEMTTMQATKEEILFMLDKLIQHTSQHFAYEEHVLRKLNYDQIEDHMIKHQLLIEKALGLRKDFLEDKGYMSTFFSFIIEDVVLKHMIQEDTRFFPTIKKSIH
ncbi:MAG TPA: hypothetical protein DEA51_00255 [Erysipelotrichaceae bacterium]|nr:hypothetical protein [Erysipelotrichaceae bacterium]